MPAGCCVFILIEMIRLAYISKAHLLIATNKTKQQCNSAPRTEMKANPLCGGCCCTSLPLVISVCANWPNLICTWVQRSTGRTLTKLTRFGQSVPPLSRHMDARKCKNNARLLALSRTHSRKTHHIYEVYCVCEAAVLRR